MRALLHRLYDRSSILRALYRPFVPLIHEEARKHLIRRTGWRFAHAIHEHTLTRNTKHGLLSFSSRDTIIGQSLYRYGEYAYPQIMMTMKVLEQHSTFKPSGAGCMVDIGANIGTVCIPLIKRGFFSRAFAFEPDPTNYRYLLANIEQNGLVQSITPLQVAISQLPGEAEFERSTDNYGDHRIRGAHVVGESIFSESAREVIHVQTDTLVGIIGRSEIAFKDVGLLWIDVQGHEWHVLKGAEELLLCGVPVVMEVWPYGLLRSGTNLQELCNLVSRYYTKVFDLGSAHPTSMPISEFKTLTEKLLYEGPSSNTDVLLLP